MLSKASSNAIWHVFNVLSTKRLPFLSMMMDLLLRKAWGWKDAARIFKLGSRTGSMNSVSFAQRHKLERSRRCGYPFEHCIFKSLSEHKQRDNRKENWGLHMDSQAISYSLLTWIDGIRFTQSDCLDINGRKPIKLLPNEINSRWKDLYISCSFDILSILLSRNSTI